VTAQGKRRFIRFLGYGGFFVACYLIALVVTFPYDVLTGFAERRASAAMGRVVTIDKVRPTLTGAVRAEGVTLGPSKRARGPQPDSSVPALRIEEARIRVGLLSWIFGGADVRFDLDVADGRVRGRYRQNTEEVALELELEGLQARRLPALRDKIGLPLKGTIDGQVEFTVPVGKANESTGSIRLELKGIVIGDGESKLSVGRFMSFGTPGRSSSAASSDDDDEGLPLPPISLGPMVIQSTVTNGEAEIPRVEAISPDVEITFEGNVKLREPVGQSRVDTYLTFKLTDAYVAQDEAVQDVMKLVNIYGRAAKRTDGAFGFRLSGSLGAGVGFRPAKSFAGGGGARGRGERGAGARRRPPTKRRPGAASARGRGGETNRIAPTPSIAPRRGPPSSPNVEGQGGNNDVYPSGMPRPPRPPMARVPPREQQEEQQAEQQEEQQEEQAVEEGNNEDGEHGEEEAEE